METIKFVHWQDSNMWIGYLEEYPDYMTQGETLDELKGNLKDLYKDLTSGVTPCDGVWLRIMGFANESESIQKNNSGTICYYHKAGGGF